MQKGLHSLTLTSPTISTVLGVFYLLVMYSRLEVRLKDGIVRLFKQV